MNITIDCRTIENSGVGVYLRGCLPFFLKTRNYYFLLGNKYKLTGYISNVTNCKIINCNIKPFSLYETFFFPKKVLKYINQSDFYYTPFFNIPCGIKVPVFSTIHDLIFLDIPEIVTRLGYLIRKLFYLRCFSLSKLIFTVSYYSKSRIDFFSKRKLNSIVTYTAVNPILLSLYNKNETISKNKCIVFIGNIKKHKGLNCLLDAFLLAKQEGIPHKLLIIGNKDNLKSSDKSILKKIQSINCKDITLTGSISNEEITKYISSAELLVQPSLYEGFCLPPLEALSLGTNVLISDIQVLKEIYDGFPVTFFKAGNIIDLKEKLINILSNESAPPSLSNEFLSKYSFEKTSSIILNEFESFYNNVNSVL